MRDHGNRHDRSTKEMRAPGVDEGKERKAVDERTAAHRRWVGDDGDGACRGID